MTQYVCDRCNSIHTKPLQSLHVPEDTTERYPSRDSKDWDKDLCSMCVKQLRQWVVTAPNIAQSK